MRRSELIYDVVKELSTLRGKRVWLLTHVGGDPDGIASCMVLSNLLKVVYGVSDVRFTIPDRVNDEGKKLCELLGLTLEPPDEIYGDAYVAVDVGSPTQLGNLSEKLKGYLLVIDHHEKSDWEGYDAKVFSSPTYQSTSEIVLELSEASSYKLNWLEATALFVGIYFDTVRLTIADPETLVKVGVLGNAMASPLNVLPYLETPIDYSERVARLKGAKRAEIYRLDDLLVAMTRVSAFRPSVARALLTLGAHIGIAAHEDGNGTEVTFRASHEVVSKYRINIVNDVIKDLTTKLGGSGGGHATAGRAVVRAGVEEVLDACIKVLSSKLGTVPKRVEG